MRVRSAWFRRALLAAAPFCLCAAPIASGTTSDESAKPIPWSFHPLAAQDPPQAQRQKWVPNPIDAFILSGLKSNSLAPAPPAPRLTLLRRACFDLTGLPPTPDQIASFLFDQSADAYERLIDKLLASNQYGERWARHWLDVVRYADTGGFENDFLYPDAWKYRDYVIRSLNANKPLDRFIQEQIAGDELWPADEQAKTATAMYCAGPVLEESAMISNQLEYEWLADSIDTTGSAFLGLTVGCARCHDHKYDPITQRDYYSLQAVFAASDRPFPAKVRLQRIKALNGLLSDAPVPEMFLDDPRCTLKAQDQVPFHLFHRAQPMDVHLLHRGQVSTPKEIMAPRVPQSLAALEPVPELASTAPDRRRAALARWLTSARNPLTARVLVNRVWAWHFGQGLVRTPNDFGNQGEPPTHPQLLDWLARDFISHGWDLKRLHKLIMLSSTYQMQSIAQGRGTQSDPQDKLLWHFPRNRLDGEEIRDAMLACSGDLNAKSYGPAVVPPLADEELAGLFGAKEKWPVTKDPDEYGRRSVYLLVRRTFTYPIFAAFDAPETMTSCPMRFQTVVPTAALTLMNGPLVRQQSRAMAKRLIRECGNDDAALIDRAFLLAFARSVTDKEKSRATEYLKLREADVDRGSAIADLCLALFNANEFVYLD